MLTQRRAIAKERSSFLAHKVFKMPKNSIPPSTDRQGQRLPLLLDPPVAASQRLGAAQGYREDRGQHDREGGAAAGGPDGGPGQGGRHRERVDGLLPALRVHARLRPVRPGQVPPAGGRHPARHSPHGEGGPCFLGPTLFSGSVSPPSDRPVLFGSVVAVRTAIWFFTRGLAYVVQLLRKFRFQIWNLDRQIVTDLPKGVSHFSRLVSGQFRED
jgi:hypothetical protein